MSLKTVFNKTAHNLITNVFKSVAKVMEFKSDRSVYNEELGEMVSFNEQTYHLTVIAGPFVDTKDSSFNLQLGDVRVIVSNTELVDNNLQMFLMSDEFWIEGVKYKLIDRQVDASESVHILQLRKV